MTANSPVPEGGAIATRVRDGRPEVLLVRANTPKREWVLPKGHLETGETAADAAVRELMEEAGIEGELLEFVDALEFIGREGPLHVQYFLIRARRTSSDGEPHREPTWFDFDQAMKVVLYEDARRLLAKARDLCVQYLASPDR
jgi:8-oxo-dGTP pyrophosphatase MutT (NUDIX family)